MRVPSEEEVHNHYLEWLCVKGWGTRKIEERARRLAEKNGVGFDEQLQVYVDRLVHELDALKRQRFVDYTLIIHDLISWCRKNDIMTGPGRGSSAGSLVYYLTGLTAIDPIEHKLLFERFLSPERVSPPDYDGDYEDSRRGEVVDYLKKKYGEENVALIATVSKLKGKSCLKDMARVFEVPYDEVNAVTSAIVDRHSGDERADHTIEDSTKESAACQEFAKRWPEVYELSVKAEGLHRGTATHAAGIVTCPVPLVDVVPIEVRREDGVETRFTAVDKDAVEELGLLKIDVLGLKTLSQIKDALRVIKQRHGVDLDMEQLEFDDKKVLRRFSDQEFVGIFQFDSTSVLKIVEGVKLTSFDDLVAVNALNRPGTTRAGVTTSWAKRKMGKEEVKSVHPVVDEITKDTYGIVLYQEQSSRIFIEVGGYTPTDADRVRKLGAKSKGAELVGKEEPKFVAGAVAKGWDESKARSLLNILKHLGSYSFNRSHSAAYSAISYWQMWLKHYYTTEFMWGLLRHEDKPEVLTKYVKEARRLGIEVRSPDVNLSRDDWTIIDSKTITAALGRVLGVGESAAKSIVAAQPFTDLNDFYARVNRRVVNRRSIASLVLADAMTALVPNKRAFVAHAEEIGDARDHLVKYQSYLSEPDYSEEDATVERQRVCPLAMGVHPLTAYESTITAMGDHVKFEDFETVIWDGQVGFFCGMLTNLKVSRINEKTDKSYAHLTIEDAHEHQLRVKLDVGQFEQHRYLVDRGEGTCVALAAIKWKSQEARLCYAVDMEDLRVGLRDGKPWEGVAALFKESPLLRYGAPAADINCILAKKMPKLGHKVELTGMVVAVKEHEDRKGNIMAFFDLAGYSGSVAGVCFGSSYVVYAAALKPMNIISVQLKRDKKGTMVLSAEDGCSVRILHTS